MGSEREIPVGDYECGICGDQFHHTSPIFGCDFGHLFCQKCYKQEFSSGKRLMCPHPFCASQMYRMDQDFAGKTHQKKRKKMFPAPEMVSMQSEQSLETKKSLHVLLKGNSGSTHSLALASKRPVNCPYPGCDKNIAVTAVDAHFKYEHKYVAFVSTCFETRNGLEFNLYDVKYNEKLCIVLINIFQEQQKDMSPHLLKTSRLEAKPVFLVMATRVPFYQLYEDESSEDIEEEEIPIDYELYNCGASDKILLWVASNIPTYNRYTLAVSTPCKAVRLKYFGPVSPLSENCIKLCEEGSGLILSQPQIVGMTNGGRKSLTLDIIVHQNGAESE